jgi:methylglutaconyl-CoA hydratase
MSYAYIALHIEANLARLTLNRPDVHNAFDDRMITELLDALDVVANHAEIRLLVLASNGKNFSAGADLAWMRAMASKNYADNCADAAQLSLLMQRLDELPQPTIALVRGAAFGGAVGLLACCDIVLAEASASFCLSEVKIGLIPAVISPYVMRAMGHRQARRYMLSGERFSAEAALAIGLVHELTADLDGRLEQLQQLLVANSPAAVKAAKRLALAIDQQPLNDATRQHTVTEIAQIRVSAEGQEGLTAFLEKRTPAWIKG